MAQHLSSLSRWIFAALCAGLATASLADAPRDPTVPPASIGSAGGNTAAPQGSTLQSVSISGKQRYAMINGIMLKVGDTVSEGRIVKITENSVIVRSANGPVTLKLFPDIDKRVHPDAKPTRQPSVRRN